MFCPSAWQEFLSVSAEKNKIDPLLLDALIEHESKWVLTAIGDDGAAIGLGQMHADAMKDIGLDPKGRGMNAATDIEATARYLAKMIDKFSGDVSLGLMAYNQGPTVIFNAANYADEVKNLAGLS